MTAAERKGKDQVRRRSGGICECCGRARAESFSHRKNRSQGGTWDPENGLHTCGDGTRGCHGWITANPKAARALGWRLWRNDDPSTEPVKLGGQWWLPVGNQWVLVGGGAVA